MKTVSIAAAVVLLALYRLAAPAHYTPVVEGTGDPGVLAERFEEVALRSTRDVSSRRALAIDLYWKAYEMAGRQGSPEELERLFGSLYAQLEGDRVARIALTPAGWESKVPPGPLILTQGRPDDHLLLIISNRKQVARTFTISGSDPALDVAGQSIELMAGATTAIFMSLTGRRPGPLHSSLRVATGGESTVVPLDCDVRPSGRLTVHVVDEKGRPTAARLFLTGADGLSHTPEAPLDRVMWMSGEHFFYSDGLFTVDLPAGRGRVEAVKGFDYVPTAREVEIEPQRTTTIDVRLRHLAGMNALGWYSGDDHIHGNYTGKQSVTPADDLLVINAEDLNVGNLMVSNSTGDQIHDERYFEGRPNALSRPDHILYWNQEMRTRDFYGHLVLLNLKQLVRPLYTGFPGSPNWEDYPSNYQQAQKAKAQGGFTIYAHPALAFDQIPTGSLAGESVVDVALGAVDAMEVFCSHDEPSMELWYKFLNCGFRLGITAGSDAFINQRFSFIAGGERVYVYAGGRFDYPSWIGALKHERAFATVGPLLFFEVEGRPPGQQFHFAKEPVKLRTAAHALSSLPMIRMEILANGKVIASVSSETPTTALEWKGAVDITRSSWLAARVWGPGNRLIANGPSRWSQRRSPLVLQAHTAPSYVYLGDSPIYSAEDRAFFIKWIDSLIEKIKRRGRFATEERRQEVIGIFLRARRAYEEMGSKKRPAS